MRTRAGRSSWHWRCAPSAAAAPAADARAKRAATPRLKAFSLLRGLIGYARRHVPPPRRAAAAPPRRFPILGGGEDGAARRAPGPGPAPAPRRRRQRRLVDHERPGAGRRRARHRQVRRHERLRADRRQAARHRRAQPRPAAAELGADPRLRRRAARCTGGACSRSPPDGAGTLLTEVDVANPAAMRVLRTLSVDGAHVSSRLHGRTARIVVASVPRAVAVPVPVAPRVGGRRRRRQAQAAARPPRRLGALVDAAQPPHRPQAQARARRLRRRAAHAAVHGRRDARRCSPSTSTRGLPRVDSDAVMTDASTVYASPGSVYVATAGGWERDDTSIHRFDIAGPRRTDYRASGAGPGRPAQPVLALRAQRRAAGRHDVGRSGREQREPRHRARDPLGPAREGRAGRRARQGRAHLRRALHRGPRLRRDLPADRPALHARPRRPARTRASAAS